MMKVAKDSECNLIKFQKRTVDAVYTKEELDKPRESPFGNTNRDQKNGLEFGASEYSILNEYCPFWFASPWDVGSVDFLMKYDPSFMKIPSALITSFDMLEKIKSTGVPVIMSTGMSTQKEITKAVEYLGNQLLYILACTSTYPTKPEEMNLRFIQTLKLEFPKHAIGFSNHSSGIIFMFAAVVLGAEMIEFHMTLDRSMYGSDQAASIESGGVSRVVKGVRSLEMAMGDGSHRVYPSEEEIKKKLRSHL